MKNKIILCWMLCLALPGWSAVTLPYIENSPAPANFSCFCHEILAKGQPEKVVPPAELDVRSCDVSAWDFSGYTKDELADVLTFDSKTVLPSKNKLPKGFNAKKILKNGKNPGLHLHKLHKQGITGKGVSVAILDQNLLTTHQEYTKNLVWYEENIWWKPADSSMHGSAVASILVGKTVGVAPQANLFFFAPEFGRSSEDRYDAAPNARALRRIAQVNKQLPAEQKIRVVSISRGFTPDDLDAKEFAAAKKALEDDGIAVFTTQDVFTLNRTHSRDNPDKADYCRPAYWLKKEKLPSYAAFQDIFAPTDFRVVAAPNGNGDYVHYANGGLSWAVPYVAGLYALGVQVRPGLTKAEFLQAVAATNDTRQCTFQGQAFTSKLVNPQKLIKFLQK